MLKTLIWGIIILTVIGGSYYAITNEPAPGGSSEVQPKSGRSTNTDKQGTNTAKELFDNSVNEVKSRLNFPSGEQTTNDRTQTIRDNTESATSTDPLKNYLVRSSEIGFPEPHQVTFAAIAARNGDFSKLKSTINTFETKLQEFSQMEVPKEAQGVHEQSKKTLEEYIDMLKDAYNQGNFEGVKNTLNSKRAQKLRGQAQNIMNQIRQLAKEENIDLPAEVLPDSGTSAPDTSQLENSRFKTEESVKKNYLEGINFLSPPRLAHIGGAGETAGTNEALLSQHGGQNTCPINDMQTDQCGGGEVSDASGPGECKRSVQLAYYNNCNYGNAPNELGEEKSLHPQDPEPACSAVSNAAACACRKVQTQGCGVVKRLFPPGCRGCCPPLPVSAEQCCGGKPWLWDKESGWVGCAG